MLSRNSLPPCLVCGAAALLLSLPGPAMASENVPHRPFASWADLPEKGQFIIGAVYEESEAYHIWAGHDAHDISVKAGGETYGIDINQGYLSIQYGITENWATDLNIGATTVGWRSFSGDNSIRSTVGLMDSSFGVRYKIWRENEENCLPTLTLRVGAVLPGSYNQHIEFAPGVRSTAIEPELLARKHFGWPGLGAYADALFRWNRTTGNDQYIAVIGLFQQIKRWELDVGYRHLHTIRGSDIVYNPDGTIVYPRDVREINDSIEAGFNYLLPRHNIRLGFHSRTVFDGSNTDRKFWVGASVDFGFGGRHD